MRLLASVILLGLAPRVSLAQSMPDTSQLGPEVVIVALDSFNFYGGHAVIVRRADQQPHDVIVIERKFVNPQIVYSALHQLAILRALEGKTIEGKGKMPSIGEFPVPNHVNGRKIEMNNAAILAGALREKLAIPQDVPGIGRGPIVRHRPEHKLTVSLDSTAKTP